MEDVIDGKRSGLRADDRSVRSAHPSFLSHLTLLPLLPITSTPKDPLCTFGESTFFKVTKVTRLQTFSFDAPPNAATKMHSTVQNQRTVQRES